VEAGRKRPDGKQGAGKSQPTCDEKRKNITMMGDKEMDGEDSKTFNIIPLTEKHLCDINKPNQLF